MKSRAAWLPYAAPMIVFGALTALEGRVPGTWYPTAYAIKIAAVTAALVFWREPFREIRPAARFILPSILLGLVIIVAWVGIDRTVPYPHLGDRVAFDPSSIASPSSRALFLATRFYGLVLVVPVMEEIFWRSFLMRFLTVTDFEALPIGAGSWTAFALMVALSSVAHPEWLEAAIASIAFGWWIRPTGSLFSSIVAHAAANGALGAYILATHDWKYW
jgi:CAAX prenyl protease-like protein